jgi:hypothetical protein
MITQCSKLTAGNRSVAGNTLIYARNIKWFKFFIIENHLFSVIHFVLLLGQSNLLNISKHESD